MVEASFLKLTLTTYKTMRLNASRHILSGRIKDLEDDNFVFIDGMSTRDGTPPLTVKRTGEKETLLETIIDNSAGSGHTPETPLRIQVAQTVAFRKFVLEVYTIRKGRSEVRICILLITIAMGSQSDH